MAQSPTAVFLGMPLWVITVGELLALHSLVGSTWHMTTKLRVRGVSAGP